MAISPYDGQVFSEIIPLEPFFLVQDFEGRGLDSKVPASAWRVVSAQVGRVNGKQVSGLARARDSCAAPATVSEIPGSRAGWSQDPGGGHCATNGVGRRRTESAQSFIVTTARAFRESGYRPFGSLRTPREGAGPGKARRALRAIPWFADMTSRPGLSDGMRGSWRVLTTWPMASRVCEARFREVACTPLPHRRA